MNKFAGSCKPRAIENHNEFLTLTKVVWSHLKVFRLSKDDSTGHSAWKKKNGRQRKRWEDIASSARAAEDRTRWKGIIVKSSVVP